MWTKMNYRSYICVLLIGHLSEGPEMRFYHFTVRFSTFTSIKHDLYVIYLKSINILHYQVMCTRNVTLRFHVMISGRWCFGT